MPEWQIYACYFLVVLTAFTLAAFLADWFE